MSVQRELERIKAGTADIRAAIAEKAIWAACAAVIAFLLGRVGL